MRVALGQFNEMTDERLTFAKQIGVSGVQMNTPCCRGTKATGHMLICGRRSKKRKAMA